MKIQEKIAKVIAKVSMFMAKTACGAASCHGYYQPKEPKVLNKLEK